MATASANAAGYTCEELIEYTSCNTGYYLNAGDCILGTSCGAGNYLAGTCPEGYEFSATWCSNSDSGSAWSANSREECENVSGNKWYGAGCATTSMGGIENFVMPESPTCTTCAAGTYQPTAGQYGCLPCPAGSYCATPGLSTTSGVCSDGTYASAGATQCTSCFPTNLTDINGDTVTAITGGNGATSLAACYISPATYFKNDKGTYHYKSNCDLAYYEPEDTSCASGYIYVQETGMFPEQEVAGCYKYPQNKQECIEITEDSYTWDANLNECICPQWLGNGKRLYCDYIPE